MNYLLYDMGKIIFVVIGILIAENLTPTLKGRFSTLAFNEERYFLEISADTPLGAGGERSGKIDSI